jgi:hypothetical protein
LLKRVIRAVETWVFLEKGFAIGEVHNYPSQTRKPATDFIITPDLMKRFSAPFFALLFAALSASAQQAIEVKRVDFKKTSDRWIQMEVQLSCEGNSAAAAADARDPRFVEKINVKVYLAFTRDASARLYDYYTSQVDIIMMEKGDDNNVYFYLPELIVERDQLQTTPDFYFVEISVDGQTQDPQKEAMSSSIANIDILNSFISKAKSEASVNDHFLMPIYLVTGVDLGRVSKLPAFLRRDVRD